MARSKHSGPGRGKSGPMEKRLIDQDRTKLSDMSRPDSSRKGYIIKKPRLFGAAFCGFGS